MALRLQLVWFGFWQVESAFYGPIDCPGRIPDSRSPKLSDLSFFPQKTDRTKDVGCQAENKWFLSVSKSYIVRRPLVYSYGRRLGCEDVSRASRVIRSSEGNWLIDKDGMLLPVGVAVNWPKLGLPSPLAPNALM